MSKSFRISVKARADLLSIGRYTELKWGRQQRNHYLKQLDDAFHLIAKNQKIGKDRSWVKTGYRSYQQGSHVIYYKVDRTIKIVRVLHKNMDVASQIP